MSVLYRKVSSDWLALGGVCFKNFRVQINAVLKKQNKIGYAGTDSQESYLVVGINKYTLEGFIATPATPHV
jgi:hypothetical protein